MTQATAIPPAPRNPTWRAGLGHRWVLGLVGVLLLFDGLLLAIVLGAVAGPLLPFEDLALDERAARTHGRVVAVQPAAGTGSAPMVRYEFTTGAGRQLAGESYGSAVAPALGERVNVEYLPDDPAVSRVVGMHRQGSSRLGSVLLGLVALPGVLLLLLWLRGAVHTRILLRDGKLTSAKIVRVAPIARVNPPHVRIDYEFTDPAGERQAGVQRPRANGPLARAIAGASVWPVVYDEARPARHRLVVAEDFER